MGGRDGLWFLKECELNELHARVLGDVMCGFFQGGGGDDKDVHFESSEALAWSCGAMPQSKPWWVVFYEGLLSWMPT
jgi:hypothetical protein